MKRADERAPARRVAPARTAAVAAAALLAATTAAATDGKDEERRGRSGIEEIVRDYLLDNPEILLQAMERLREKQRAAREESDRSAVRGVAKELFRDPEAPVGGNPAGDLTLVEFFDYQCGVCKRVHPVVAELVRTDPGLRRVYKEWPILGPGSVLAAKAALAARGQGKYLALHDALMEARGALDEAAVMRVAASAGLDVGRLRRDMAAPGIERIIRRNHALAARLDLEGTPSFVLGDRIVRGGLDLDSLRSLAAKARAAR